MEAVITRVILNAGAESGWVAAMRDRMTAAESAAGWIGGSILTPDDDPSSRVILGLWEDRAAWERWHGDPAFHDTAERLEGLEQHPGDASWHAIVYAGGRFQA